MLPSHGLLFPWFFYTHHLIDRIAPPTAFVTPVMEQWLEQEIAQWVHHEGSNTNIYHWLFSTKEPLICAGIIFTSFTNMHTRVHLHMHAHTHTHRHTHWVEN